MCKIENLEIELAGTDTDSFMCDFMCDVERYDTVLSYFAKTNPEALCLMPNPVHNNIIDGNLSVAACDHMKRRFPKAAHVNA